MTLKGIKPVILVIASLFLCFSMLGQQKPTQSPQKDQNMDKYDDAHQSMMNQVDKAKEVSQFTDQMSKSLPTGSAAMAKMPRKNFIDNYIFDRIERDGIPHSGLSSDTEFLRRVYLDATGFLPTAEKVREFTASKDPDKRDKLIESLIGTEEFAQQWAWFWGDLYRLNQLSGNGKDAFQEWTKEWLKVDRPYNLVAKDLLSGSSKSYGMISQMAFLGRILQVELKNKDLTDPDNFGATVNRLDAIDDMNVEIGRLFLGINMDCISCHDGAGHLEPINLYLSDKTRQEFSQQAAFLGKMRMIGIYNVGSNELLMDDLAKGYDTRDDAPYVTEAESRFPRTGQTFQPAFILTGEKPKPGINPRVELARMITTNIQFSRVTVNLIWGKLMTLGLVEPWDGFDMARLDPKNPPPKPWGIQPANPELLEALAVDFQKNNHSMHHLMKTIMKSTAYQLSAQFPAQWKEAYTPYYARKYIRVMTGPEVVDTVAQVTGRPYEIKYLDADFTTVKQVSELGAISGLGGSKNRDSSDIASIMNSFFETNREAPVPIGNKATTLQALLMMRSNLVNDRVLAEKGSRVEKLLASGKTNEQIIEELYLVNLSRWPTPIETKTALDLYAQTNDRKKATENLEWTLLNGAEFLINH
jgi:uncharacterized protein YukE